MTDKARVRFLDSCKSRRTFVHYLVFKKNQSKNVLDKKKLKWIFGSLFIVLLTSSLIQDPESKKERVEAIKVSLTPEFIEVPEKSKKEIVKSDRHSKAKPLPGLKLVERSNAMNPVTGNKLISAMLVGKTSDGPVKAKVTKSIELQDVFIPKDTMLIGTANTKGDRLQIDFEKANIPFEESITLKGKAIDPRDGGYGLRGSLSLAKAAKFFAKVGLDFTSGLTEGLKEKETADNGQVVDKSTVKNALLNGSSNAAMEAARGSLQKLQSGPELVSLPSGTAIQIEIEEIE